MTKTLFRPTNPGVYLKSQLYDPDQPSLDSKIVPQIGSIIIEKPGSPIAYTVIEITDDDQSILEPLASIFTEEGEAGSIVDYSNWQFMLFFDNRVNPTEIQIDTLLRTATPNDYEYRLTRVNKFTGDEETVSVYYDTDGTHIGSRIPIRQVSNTDTTRYFTNCHTLLTIDEGEEIIMEVFSAAGAQTGRVKLFAREARILNNLDEDPIIIDFQLNTPQTKDDAIFLYEGQAIEQLTLSPTLVYRDRPNKIVPIDNERCFIYGLDNLIPSRAGMKVKILAKYFLRTTEEAVADVLLEDNHGRAVHVEKDLIVWPRQTIFSTKVSAIPVWNNSLSEYTLRYFLYTSDRNNVYDITSSVEHIQPLAGSDFNNEQEVIIRVNLRELFNLNDEAYHVQNIFIRLKEYAGYERYIIKETEDNDYAYGVESVERRRPVIHYDDTLEQYFIPTSIFANKEAMVESFYSMARPPFNPQTELSPATPTHFTIRSATTKNAILPSPIPIEEYEQIMTLIGTGSSDQYVNQTVVVEFLLYTEASYLILYGVPVDVYLSEIGYNE